jgi:hypothetical protein
VPISQFYCYSARYEYKLEADSEANPISMSNRISLVPEPIFSLATEIASIWIRGNRYLRLAIGFATGLAAAAGILWFVWNLHRIAQFCAISAGLLLIGVLAYQKALERSERAERIVEIEREVEKNPDKAKPAWDLASAKLEEYVARNLSQIAWIFVLVLIVMTVGFVIIGWGVYKVFSSQSIGPSVVAAVSGIVIEFIAATFLLIYRSTMEQAKDYVAMLERINAVGMSAQLLESIEDADPKVRDKARAELEGSLLQMYSQSQSKGRS